MRTAVSVSVKVPKIRRCVRLSETAATKVGKKRTKP